MIKKPQLSLNYAVVEFLKKYEVYVKPVTANERSSGDVASGAVAGAIGGIAGADVAGDAFIVRGQAKQTAIQEWTQWKQWALDHKDFPKFQTDLFNKIDQHNKDVDKKLQDPEYQKNVLDPLIEANDKRNKLINKFVGIMLGLLIGFPIVCYVYFYLNPDKPNENSITNSEKKDSPLDIDKENSFKVTCLNCVQPKYPREALRQGLEGKPTVKVFILKSGYVSKAEIKNSSGVKLIDRAALVAAQKSKFYPIPSDSFIEIEYDLKLK